MIELAQQATRPGRYFFVGLSVMAPGLLLIADALLLTAPLNPQTLLPDLHAYKQLADQAGVAGTILIAALLVLVAYCLGFVTRTIMFSLRQILPTDTSLELAGLDLALSASTVDAILEKHSMRDFLRRRPPGDPHDLEQAREPPPLPAWLPLGRRPPEAGQGAHLEAMAYRVVTDYCTGWLRSREPALSVDLIEIEVNLLLTALPAFVLGLAVVERFTLGGMLVRFSWGAVVVAVLTLAIGGYVAWMMDRKAGQLQAAQGRDALRNFVIGNHYIQVDSPALGPLVVSSPANVD